MLTSALRLGTLRDTVSVQVETRLFRCRLKYLINMNPGQFFAHTGHLRRPEREEGVREYERRMKATLDAGRKRDAVRCDVHPRDFWRPPCASIRTGWSNSPVAMQRRVLRVPHCKLVLRRSIRRSLDGFSS